MKRILILFICFSIYSASVAQEMGQYIKDIDGNEYQAIQIGDQVWMNENLKTTRYRDGSQIAHVGFVEVWTQLDAQQSAAFTWYNYDENNKYPYGGYYNVHAMKSEKLCPTGWKVPTLLDWDILIDSLGDHLIVGGWLKASGTLSGQDGLWLEPNAGATDSVNFKAVPGGVISNSGTAALRNRNAYYWSSSIGNTHTNATFLKYDATSALQNNFSNGFGFTVRCLKE